MRPNNIFRYFLPLFIWLAAGNPSTAQNDEPILNAVKAECDRNLQELKIEDLQQPFFISFSVAETHEMTVSAVLGALATSFENRFRTGSSSLLTGNYERNNLINYAGSSSASGRIPLDNKPEGIRTVIWRDLDNKYKAAAREYESRQTQLRQQQLKEEDRNLIDFEKREPVSLSLPQPKASMDRAYWENYVIKASEIVRKYPEITSSRVVLTARDRRLHYYNTEQSRYSIPEPYYALRLILSTRAEDGQELNDILFVEHSSPEQMPLLADFIRECEEFIHYFLELRKAPLLDDAYNGPVLFEKMALAEAFQNKFFGMTSLIAQRAPASRVAGGNSLEMMMDKKVTSRDLSVKSLSGTEAYNGIRLDGYFPVDAEGVVPDKELTLIENGVLRNMLNGRTPTRKIAHSNGHSRLDPNSMRSRIAPGNLHLLSNDVCSSEELKSRLIAAAKEEDLDCAYIVRRLRGNSVLAIYRVDVNTGEETLVRGANLSDFTMKSFKRVLGASDKEFLYNTTSFGNITTYIVPEALLFEELEVVRSSGIQLNLPYTIPQPQMK